MVAEVRFLGDTLTSDHLWRLIDDLRRTQGL